jgi:predicted HicB family RNase H-like nuclease
MKNLMEYNGYKGIVEFSAEDQVFFGKIFGITDLITFEGDSVKALEKAFHEAVDDYIQTCKEEGKEPERVYKGSFNIRINPDIHRMAAFKAQSLHMSLNEFVEKAVAKEVETTQLILSRSVNSKSGRAKAITKSGNGKSNRKGYSRKKSTST